MHLSSCTFSHCNANAIMISSFILIELQTFCCGGTDKSCNVQAKAISNCIVHRTGGTATTTSTFKSKWTQAYSVIASVQVKVIMITCKILYAIKIYIIIIIIIIVVVQLITQTYVINRWREKKVYPKSA